MTTAQLKQISEDPAKYLSQALTIDKQMSIKYERLSKLYSAASSVTSKASLAPGRSGTSDKVGEGVLAIMEVYDELDEQLFELARVQKNIEQAIQELVCVEKHRLILEARYLACLPWPKVAENMGKALRWTMTLHERALKELTANCLLKLFERA